MFCFNAIAFLISNSIFDDSCFAYDFFISYDSFFSYDPFFYLCPFLLHLIVHLSITLYFIVLLKSFSKMLYWIYLIDQKLHILHTNLYFHQKVQNCYIPSNLLLEIKFQYVFFSTKTTIEFEWLDFSQLGACEAIYSDKKNSHPWIL